VVPRATNALRQLRESYVASYLRFGGNGVKGNLHENKILSHRTVKTLRLFGRTARDSSAPGRRRGNVCASLSVWNSSIKNICYWRDAILGKGPLILRRLREQFQRGFWRMPGPTV
jgi:hypothetical protein